MQLQIRQCSTPRIKDYGVDIPDPRSLGLNTPGLGEKLFEEPEPILTGFEESSETEEWKFVERILPKEVVPPPPAHASYPTPSGWVPPKESSQSLPYYVRRTRFHQLPIYLEILNGGNRKMTMVKKVNGDIWAFEAELRKYLEEKTGGRIYTQVDEVCCKLRVRGIHVEDTAKFVLDKGF
ncbi:39S ribosomal protein L49, mitochondrial [Lamellibrachia satsuma]|nr:39S ribosomal protein L49, mitochondrial [Lamellibrachia satsuma]